MRLMTWCLGVLVLFADHAAAVSCGHESVGTWYALFSIWMFVGVVALTVAVVRLVSGRLKAGQSVTPGVTWPTKPAGKHEE